MADLIDRQALIDRLNPLYEHHLQMGNYAADGAVADCIEIVTETPAVEPKGEWISVEDALPTDNTLYLVKLDSRGTKLRHAAVDTDRISIHGGWVRWQGYVTHWMPFPIWLL